MRVIRKLERSRGTFLLVTPYWKAQTWFASLQALHVEDVRHLPFSDDLIIDLTTGEPPPNLERLFLVVWTILGGIGESTPSRTGPSVSSRQDGSDPQKTATKERGNPSRPSSIPLHQASLRSVLDYLTHLYDHGFLWSTIGIHRSTLSMMHQSMVSGFEITRSSKGWWAGSSMRGPLAGLIQRCGTLSKFW
jgi:hypothetical protein